LLLNVQDALFALRRDAEPFDAWRGGRELICHQARQKVNSVNMADRAQIVHLEKPRKKNPGRRFLHLMLFDRLPSAFELWRLSRARPRKRKARYHLQSVAFLTVRNHQPKLWSF
jgi:hypothetical protein